MKGFYSGDEVAELVSLRGTERDVETRMPVKITRHYFEMAKHSKPLQKLVKADANETLNLAGSEDPGYQMDFSPVEGLLHKYEMGLMYVVSTCSAHCRFCYREELIARKEIERQDGTVPRKASPRSLRSSRTSAPTTSSSRKMVAVTPRPVARSSGRSCSRVAIQ